MATNSGTAQIFKGALVSVPLLGTPKVLSFQYNPANMQRSLTPNMVGGEEQDRTMAVSFKGPPSQTINVSVEFDAAPGLNSGDSTEVENGVYAQLAALELLVTPDTIELMSAQTLLNAGMMEIQPLDAPTLYFVWGPSRVLPVRVTQFSVTEELFDGHLNPIQATVALTMRVLSVSDVSFTNKAWQQYIVYQQKMEEIAPKVQGSMSATGATIG